MDLKFLIVDDSITIRRIVSNTLQKLGYLKSVDAVDGLDALQKLYNDSEINFIITDWNMPNINGLELTKKIRSIPKWEEIPILMITTKGAKNDIIDALKARVTGYVVKPFTPDILRDKINNAVNNSLT